MDTAFEYTPSHQMKLKITYLAHLKHVIERECKRFVEDLHINPLYELLISLFHKLAPDLTGAGKLRLVGVELLVHEDKPLHSCRLRQITVHPEQVLADEIGNLLFL